MAINTQQTLNNLQNDTNRVYFQNSRKNLGKDRLDREGFMRLMMAQLQYQDPMDPKDHGDMLTQQLQLEQADQMSRLVSSNKFAQAGSMVGQTVELIDSRWNFETNMSDPPEWDYQTNGPKSLTGEVESVQFDRVHDKALIKINGNYYDVDQVRQVIMPMQPLPPAGS